MGIFDKKQSVSRRELRGVFKKHSGTIPGTGGRKYFQQERERIVEKRLRLKYGSEISKDEYRRVVRDLKSAQTKAKTPEEKKKIEQEFKYWKGIGGKNI